ncbi:S-adenosyl-L-methionine-dependent methyltransferase [Violaceomyces palustris]|uniref:S-adenosyl-L-methionine-dependent methyltransferase n=1 Tax=Violaceomyces palustris TaxID=1673888 RepID=A0ACD0P3X3_9BASI|nr:S-adenosyl-L-methionine-dependent methyltransferase [Violaceomyces palustris]
MPNLPFKPSNPLDYSLKEDDEDDVDDVSDDHADEDDVNEEDKEGGGVEQGDDPNLQSTRSKPERRKRLERLSNFQVKMLRHAMRFPNLGRLVYSTCSVHPEENEGVVIRILKSPEALERGWVLAGREEVLPDWKVRGLKEFCQGDDVLADSVIRCIPGGNPCVKYEGVGGEGGEGDGRLRIHPHTEASNGFFVACFKRKTSQEEGDDTDRGEQGRTEGSGKVNPDESDEEERERRERRRREMNRKKNQAKKRREKERKVAIQSDPTSGAHPTPP